MGQPPVRGLERQRDIAAQFDHGARPFKGAPLLRWPWKGAVWGTRVPGYDPADPSAVRSVILYNRLDVKDAQCGPVPIVIKISGVKDIGASCTDVRETVVSRVVRRLVARGALVNAAVPLYITGGAAGADSPQTLIRAVLLGPASGGELPAAIEAAFRKANLPEHGVVLVSFAAVRNCPPAPSASVGDPFAAFHASLRTACPNQDKIESAHHLFTALEAALKAPAGGSPSLRAHVTILLRSVLAQLALAYATVNQAGVQHLDGHLSNVLVAPSAPFTIVAETAPGVHVPVPVRGCLVQVFDWDWSVKWPMAVNDQFLGTRGFGDTARCMSTPPGQRGFVHDHRRRVGNADWARVLLLLSGGFPRCFALLCDAGVAQSAFGDGAASAARSSGISVTFRLNKGRFPFEHGFLAVGPVTDCEPCTDHSQVQAATVALPKLCEARLELDQPAPASATHAVRLPFAISGGKGETRLFDSSATTPRCPLFPTPEQARAAASSSGGRSRPAAAPTSPSRQARKKKATATSPAKKKRKTPTPAKARATPTKKSAPKKGLLQRLRGWFTGK